MAIPHNSKCRYGERGTAAAKPKAQIILDAAKVSAASGGCSEPKQGQRSQSARGFCPRSTMRVPQPDIIEYFGNVDAVPQLPERCLSRKAGIVRCCLKDTAPAHACQTPLAIWTGVWDNGLQQRAMPFAPGRIDRRNGAQERPPIFPRKVDVFYGRMIIRFRSHCILSAVFQSRCPPASSKLLSGPVSAQRSSPYR